MESGEVQIVEEMLGFTEPIEDVASCCSLLVTWSHGLVVLWSFALWLFDDRTPGHSFQKEQRVYGLIAFSDFEMKMGS